ncbi:MAG: hypothetical protein IT304_03595 [Dehalococcoidia bacterium]|nr:hypothetical protein [Dehalococcoidia bacterium]
MTLREDVARAMAFFEATNEIGLLHQLTAELAPRARRLVADYLQRGSEDDIPAPAELRPARQPATREAAARTVRTTNDFALLQVLARSIGQRIEAIEIAASAEFPTGARVRVPAQPGYPPRGTSVEGTVEESGTSLQVLLDNGETWHGPASLARLAGQP